MTDCNECDIKNFNFPDFCPTIRDCKYYHSSNKHALCPRGKGSECLVATTSWKDDEGNNHFHIAGERQLEIHSHNDSVDIRFNFCPLCGSPISWHAPKSAYSNCRKRRLV